MIETNFYRRVKMGSKKRSTMPSPEKTAFKSVGLMGKQSSNNLAGLHRQNSNFGQEDNFSITLPAGAKVVAFAGTADDYLRSILAYYKI